jgi:hypothetical protein
MKLLKTLIKIVVITLLLIIGLLSYLKYVHYPNNPLRYESYVVRESYRNNPENRGGAQDVFYIARVPECITYCSEETSVEDCTYFNKKYDKCTRVCPGGRKTTCSWLFEPLLYSLIEKMP